MKKTNLRIKDYFIFEDKNEYFLSSINDLEEWKNLKENDFEESKENKITSRLNDLMEEYEIYSNVNFFDVEDDKKIIEVDHKGG